MTNGNGGFSLEQDQGPFESAVQLFIHIRDQIKAKTDAFEQSLEPLKRQKEQLEGIISTILEQNGQESARTQFGTAYLSERRTCSLTDADAFMQFVTENQLFDLIERRGSAIAVDDYAKEHQGQLPPGCKLTKVQTVNVRRS